MSCDGEAGELWRVSDQQPAVRGPISRCKLKQTDRSKHTKQKTKKERKTYRYLRTDRLGFQGF